MGQQARKVDLNLIAHTIVARSREKAASEAGHTHAPNRYCQTTEKITCGKKGVHTRGPKNCATSVLELAQEALKSYLCPRF
jgi:hypothetical protein